MIWIPACLVALALAALLAVADGALLAVDPDREAGDVRLRAVLATRDHAHRALSLGALLAMLTTGALTAVVLGALDLPDFLRPLWVIAATLMLLLIGETLPRQIGDALGARALRPLSPVVRVVTLLLSPIVRVGAAIDRALYQALPPGEPSVEDRETSEEQFRQVVQAEADVRGEERTILGRVFTLGDTEVQEVMVPRVDIVGLERDTPWSEVLDRVRSSEHARLPVYEDTLDHITGVLFAKDLLAPVIADAEPDAGWLSLVRPASFIPEAKTIDAQLRDFKATGAHIAIVVDEYGGTAGLVTIEDILEEIVGDIRDERDTEEPPIEVEEGRRFWVSGRVSLEDLSEVTGHDFERPDVSTVGGLIFDLLGRVPRAGEELIVDDFRVVVERVVRRRVERVYLERLSPVAGHPA